MKQPCTVCRKAVTITAEGKYRLHGPRNAPCPGGGTPGPALMDEQREETQIPAEAEDDYDDALAALDALNSDEDEPVAPDNHDPVATLDDADALLAELNGRPGSDRESAALSDEDNAESIISRVAPLRTFDAWVPQDPEVAATKAKHEELIAQARGLSSVPESSQKLAELQKELSASQVALEQVFGASREVTAQRDEARRELDQERQRSAELEAKIEETTRVLTEYTVRWYDAEAVAARAAELGGTPLREELECAECEPEPSETASETSDNDVQAEFTDDGKIVCPVCSQRVSVTAKNEYRVHGPKANRCAHGGQPVAGIAVADPATLGTVELVVTDPKDTARARGIRVPATPAFVGEQEVPSLGATVALGHDPAIRMAMRLVQMQVPLSCDIETEGLGNAARFIKSVTFCDVPEGRLVAILDPRDPDQAKVITWVFDNAPELDFFNSPFDVPNLAINWLLTVAHAAKIVDLILYARLAEPSNLVPKTLGACAERYLGVPQDSTGLMAAGKAVGMRNKEQIFREMDLDRPVYVRGAAADAVYTARLKRPLQRAALTRLTTGHPFADWGVQGSEALHLLQREQKLNRMSLRRSGIRGLPVDLDFLDRYNAANAQQIEVQARQLTDLGIRPGVSADLLTFLENADAIPEDYPVTKKTKAPSGAKDDLAKIVHPVARLFTQHKEQVHILHDYLEKVRDHAVEMPDGTLRIFPVVNYFGATTGRQSVAGDPLQQFPEEARGVILAEPGTQGLSSIDWSQIEPVTIANIAGQFDMLEGYESGEMDFYDTLAQATHLPRKQNKTQLLGTLYGQGLGLTAAKLGVDRDEARRIKDAVFAPMPKVLELTHTLREIGETHQMVPTVSGRIIPVPSGWYTDPNTGERTWSVQTHKAVNYFVQGSAYDLLAESALACEEQGLGDAIALLMHDEVVCDTEAAEDIRKIMEKPPERLVQHAGRTPILRTDMAHMGERWAKV